MITSIRKYITKILGLCLLVATLALASCTYDYFRDENNFRLYVPQIKDRSITNFHVAFHNANGDHIITREITAPFDDNDLMRQGILRFKLPPGEGYYITCFADYDPAAVTPGNPYAESSLKKVIDESRANVYHGSNTVYTSRTTNPRSLFLTATAYPIGHAESLKEVTADINTDRQYKGRIQLEFIDLPATAGIARIDAYYSGLSTNYYFDGTFRRFTTDDRIRGSYLTADYQSGNTVTTDDVINPSTGTYFGSATRMPEVGSPLLDPNPLELELHLYDASDNSIGVITFTKDDFDLLADDKKPTDGYGAPVSSLVLESQQTIKFTFKGFTLIGIEMAGWGDINEGSTTPI